MPLVSIVVPVYNVEKYLPKCIESILTQSFTDFELILVDDGSPDNCGAICDEYARKDDRIHVIHKENGGVSGARNVALECVTGKYLTFCDSDDKYAPDWLADLLSAMEETAADMVVGGYARVAEDGRELSRKSIFAGVIDCTSLEQKVDYCIREVLEYRQGWEIWTRLFRTDIIRNHNIRFCEDCQNFAEDLGFTLEYSLYADRVTAIDEAGYLYTVRTDSMMRSSVGKIKLNSVNEVALSLLEKLPVQFVDKKWKHIPCVFHYLIMQNQYQAMIECGQYRHFHDYITQVSRYGEWKYWTRQILRYRKELQSLVGTQQSRWIILFTVYHLYGIWPVFAVGNELLERVERRHR